MKDEEDCPFCKFQWEDDFTAIAVFDKYPVSKGHTLIFPKRHIGSIFETTLTERDDIFSLLYATRELLIKKFAPDSFNIGINDGPAAGQTIPHLHIHLIPRYKGDMPDPRGGIRWIFPDLAKYWND